MDSLEASEAQTHLGLLLERMAHGERIVITSGRKPVAMLMPPEQVERSDVAEVGRAMIACRDKVQRGLGGSFRDLAHDGHRD
ncbi:MAG: type II toxin-antitoxin system prevent-host-death family antitoxin [Isosphaeraceae bacterium]